MALPEVGDAAYQTPEEVLAQTLTDLRSAYVTNNFTLNVSKGTEPYLRAQAFSNRVSLVVANNRVALKDISPLDATGDALVELAGVYGITKRPASSAAGVVTIKSSGPVTIPIDFQLTAPDGIQYQTTAAVTVDGSVDGGATVIVQAVSAGTNTVTITGTRS